MRQADLNRVDRARKHLKDATDTLNKIPWDKVNNMEYRFLLSAKDAIESVKMHLDDIINIQKP